MAARAQMPRILPEGVLIQSFRLDRGSSCLKSPGVKVYLLSSLLFSVYLNERCALIELWTVGALVEEPRPSSLRYCRRILLPRIPGTRLPSQAPHRRSWDRAGRASTRSMICRAGGSRGYVSPPQAQRCTRARYGSDKAMYPPASLSSIQFSRPEGPYRRPVGCTTPPSGVCVLSGCCASSSSSTFLLFVRERSHPAIRTMMIVTSKDTIPSEDPAEVAPVDINVPAPGIAARMIAASSTLPLVLLKTQVNWIEETITNTE